MTLYRILWVAGNIWAVGLPSPKQWCPDREQHCSIQMQNPPTMMELLHMYIRHSHSEPSEGGKTEPYLVNQEKKVCEYLIMFYRSILPKSGSFLHPFPGAAG